MAQCVRVDVRGKALGDGNFLNDAADTTRGKPAAPTVDEQRGRVLARAGKKLLSFGEIGYEPGFHRLSEWNVSFFLPLAADENRLGTQPDVVKVDSREFRIADAASVKQLQHEPVALGEGCHLGHLAVNHGVHFFNRRYAR